MLTYVCQNTLGSPIIDTRLEPKHSANGSIQYVKICEKGVICMVNVQKTVEKVVFDLYSDLFDSYFHLSMQSSTG